MTFSLSELPGFVTEATESGFGGDSRPQGDFRAVETFRSFSINSVLTDTRGSISVGLALQESGGSRL